MTVAVRISPDDEIIQPLLTKDGDETAASSVYSEAPKDANKVKSTTGDKLTVAVVAAVVAAGAASSIVSFIMYPAIIVYVAGGVCLFNCPIVIYKQSRLMAFTALRNIVNGLRVEAGRLENSIDDLKKEVDDLKIVHMRFIPAEEEFREMVDEQGVTVEQMIDLVKENQEIVDLMRENIRERIVQDVIGTVVRTTGDYSQKIGKAEASRLALKIKVKLEVYGILFDEEKFLQAVALKPTFMGALAVVKKLLPVEYRDGDFTDHTQSLASSYFSEEELDEDDVYDMFYMTREEQARRGSVLAVREVFRGHESSRKISLAASRRSSGMRWRESLARSRLTSSDDIIVGAGNLFPVREAPSADDYIGEVSDV